MDAKRNPFKIRGCHGTHANVPSADLSFRAVQSVEGETYIQTDTASEIIA